MSEASGQKDLWAKVKSDLQRASAGLPPGSDPSIWVDGMLRYLWGLKDRDGRSVDPRSPGIDRCMRYCASINMIPSDVDQQLVFTPRKGQWVPTLMYRGAIKLAFDSGFIKSLYCRHVMVDDEFYWWTEHDGPKLFHRPNRSAATYRPTKDGAEQLDSAYCLYRQFNGERGVVVLPISEIRERAGDNWNNERTPWWTHRPAMACKSAIKAAMVFWQLKGRFGAALREDESLPEDESDDRKPGKQPADRGEQAEVPAGSSASIPRPSGKAPAEKPSVRGRQSSKAVGDDGAESRGDGGVGHAVQGADDGQQRHQPNAG